MDEFVGKVVNIFGWNVDWTAAWPFIVLFVLVALPAAWDRFHGR